MIRRCTAAIFPRQNFLDVLEGNPDLYGPVWIAMTVVVILFLTGTISQYLAHTGKDHFAYDFKLLSGGAGLIFGYTGLVPLKATVGDPLGFDSGKRQAFIVSSSSGKRTIPTGNVFNGLRQEIPHTWIFVSSTSLIF